MPRKWLQTINVWRVRRYAVSQESWERVRAKGRGRYVLREGLTLYGAKATSLYSYIGRYFFTGIVMGYMTWGEQEKRYKEALVSPPVTAPIDNQILPR